MSTPSSGEPPAPLAEGSSAQSPVGPILRLRGFGVAFGHGSEARVVLADVNLALADRLTVLMGPVKTGKSTLLRTLAGLYQGHPLHRVWGVAELAGRPVGEGNRPLLLQQHARALHAPPWQVLREAQPRTGEAAARSVAQWRQWAVEQLERHGLRLSAAQLEEPLHQADPLTQRRVMALAQALARPPLLLLDEPCAGLSDAQAEALLDGLRALAAWAPLWVALHNQRQARRVAQSIVLLGGGRVLAHQACEDFFQRPANGWVQQFVRSGSLPLPSPSARTQDLAEGTPAPPPLPPQALAALGLAAPDAALPVLDPAPSTPAPLPPASEPPTAPPPASGAHAVSEVASAEPSSRAEPAALAGVALQAQAGPAQPAAASGGPRRPLAAMPTPLAQGVELASTVGQVMWSDSRGPRGFRWVVPGVLAGCPQPGVVAPLDHDLALLEKAGITHLITLTEHDLDQEALSRWHLCNTHLPIFDGQAPSLHQMHLLLARMQRLLAAGEVLAVHCRAGLGRTGLVLAAWLVRDGGLSAEAAVQRLRKIEPGFIQTDAQLAFLHEFEHDILRRLG